VSARDDRGPGASSFIAPNLLDETAEDLYEHAPCGYLATDADGVIVKVNETFVTMTGYGREALIGRRFLDLFTVGGRIFYETHLRPLLQMQGFVREVALDMVRADGQQMPVLVNATENNAHGSATVTRISVFDATERRRYERELLLARNNAEISAQAKGDLIGMISHDVRAPLSAVLAAAAMLEKAHPELEGSRYVRIIRSSTMNAVSLLNSILEMSRLDSGRSALRDRPFEPKRMVEQVVAGVRLASTRHPGVAIRVAIDPNVPQWVLGDREKVAQVLTNLLSNAAKFTDRGFITVILSTRELAPESVLMEFMVSDTGIGIPPDRLPHIFDEFTQASDDIAERYGGSGLGLAICQKLLRLYGSELHVTSAVGQGTTFSFILRLRTTAQGAKALN